MSEYAAAGGNPSSPAGGGPRRRTAGATLDLVLLVAATAAMTVALGLLFATVVTHLSVYDRAIDTELAGGRPLNHAAILAYARSRDFAAAKFASMFLGFALIFLGAGYILRVARATFRLSAGNEKVGTGALATTSPGLVMVTLGAGLVALGVVTKSSVDLGHNEQRLTFHDAADVPSLRMVDDAAD